MIQRFIWNEKKEDRICISLPLIFRAKECKSNYSWIHWLYYYLVGSTYYIYEEIKAIIIKKKIVPNHYYKKVYNRLQSLYQGSRSIDKYFKKMEITIIKNNVFEDREATITWFLNGLDR